MSELIKKKCASCDKVIEGTTEKQVDYNMSVHRQWVHRKVSKQWPHTKHLEK